MQLMSIANYYVTQQHMLSELLSLGIIWTSIIRPVFTDLISVETGAAISDNSAKRE